VDPSGAYFGWKATAIGKNHVNAKNFLEKRYNEEMELDDAVHTALLTLREGFEGYVSLLCLLGFFLFLLPSLPSSFRLGRLSLQFTCQEGNLRDAHVSLPPSLPPSFSHREMNEHNIEIGIIGADRKFRILTPAEVKDYLDEAN